MNLSRKTSAIAVICAALSPFATCLVLAFFVPLGTVITLSAAYAVFGLLFVLGVGWLFAHAAEKSKNPPLWILVSYGGPALFMNLAIIALAVSA